MNVPNGLRHEAWRDIGNPPQGFASAVAQANGADMHYVRGGTGPAIILIHGFPETWAEYRAIMPRLAQHFTVIAIDLPGMGRSSPAKNGYEVPNLAAHVHSLMAALKVDRPYIAGHDLGGIVTYAYVRRYPETVRGALILDVPMPGIAGWEQAVAGMWHIGFIQVPGLAEDLVTGRQEAFLGRTLEIGAFTQEQRSYYFGAYGADQLHAAFEVYRAFPKDAEWNAAQTENNNVPLTVAVGARSFFASHLNTFVKGYREKGMAQVDGATIPDAHHYVLADNPDAVARLIAAAGSSN